jgi:hypothetical protein
MERFWKKVRKTEGCWEWIAAKQRFGYGVIRADDARHTLMPAHRFSWQLHRGPIPKGQFVLHRCDNPACVRPDHLFLGTQFDNMTDMTAKGKRPVKLNVAQVHVIKRLKGNGLKLKEVATAFRVSVSTIHRIWDRRVAL